jgi:uncharacterized protein DUF4149
MLALRYVCLLALTLWVGGLVVLGAIAAPSIFDVIDLRQAADGRSLAGAIFGEMLRRFHLLSYGCGGVVLGGLIARAVLGPRPRRFAFRLALAAVMLAAAAYSGLIVSPRIRQAQAEIGVAASSLPADDPRRIGFGRMHRASAALQIVPIVGGLLLLFWETKE